MGEAIISRRGGGEYGTATAADVIIGKTIGTENGIVSGTGANAKRVASGTTPPSTIGPVGSFPPVVISGLPFTPKIFYFEEIAGGAEWGLREEYAGFTGKTISYNNLYTITITSDGASISRSSGFGGWTGHWYASE